MATGSPVEVSTEILLSTLTRLPCTEQVSLAAGDGLRLTSCARGAVGCSQVGKNTGFEEEMF